MAPLQVIPAHLWLLHSRQKVLMGRNRFRFFFFRLEKAFFDLHNYTIVISFSVSSLSAYCPLPPPLHNRP